MFLRRGASPEQERHISSDILHGSAEGSDEPYDALLINHHQRGAVVYHVVVSGCGLILFIVDAKERSDRGDFCGRASQPYEGRMKVRDVCRQSLWRITFWIHGDHEELH